MRDNITSDDTYHITDKQDESRERVRYRRDGSDRGCAPCELLEMDSMVVSIPGARLFRLNPCLIKQLAELQSALFYIHLPISFENIKLHGHKRTLIQLYSFIDGFYVHAAVDSRNAMAQVSGDFRIRAIHPPNRSDYPYERSRLSPISAFSMKIILLQGGVPIQTSRQAFGARNLYVE